VFFAAADPVVNRLSSLSAAIRGNLAATASAADAKLREVPPARLRGSIECFKELELLFDYMGRWNCFDFVGVWLGLMPKIEEVSEIAYSLMLFSVPPTFDSASCKLKGL